jgi:hypothetical protein
MTARNVCFTINNYATEDILGVAEVGWSYVIVGWEVGESGTPHMQGYGELAKVTRWNTLKKLMPRAHMEGRRGTQKEALEYCKKEGSFTQHGTPRQQGARHDLDLVRTDALEGGMRSVTSWANMQGIRVAEKFLAHNEEARDWECEVHWLWGKTGVGKSRIARELCSNKDDIYVKNTATKWWDGYDGHENVIIDDFRPSWWDLTYMLSLLDRYEFRVETKGGHRQFRPRTIVVTSALPPDRCYSGTGECVQQLLRRVSLVSEVGGVILDSPPTTVEAPEWTLEDVFG